MIRFIFYATCVPLIGVGALAFGSGFWRSTANARDRGMGIWIGLFALGVLVAYHNCFE